MLVCCFELTIAMPMAAIATVAATMATTSNARNVKYINVQEWGPVHCWTLMCLMFCLCGVYVLLITILLIVVLITIIIITTHNHHPPPPPANRQTKNKQDEKQSNKQTDGPAGRRTSKHANMQASKQIIKQTKRPERVALDIIQLESGLSMAATFQVTRSDQQQANRPSHHSSTSKHRAGL